MLQVNRISARRYTLTDLSSTGEVNLHLFSQGRNGQPGDMIEVTNTITITKPLSYEQAMLLYCLLKTKTHLTDEEWELILPECQNTIAAVYQ